MDRSDSHHAAYLIDRRKAKRCIKVRLVTVRLVHGFCISLALLDIAAMHCKRTGHGRRLCD
eukprot:6481768-Amphidinium_carterae.2